MSADTTSDRFRRSLAALAPPADLGCIGLLIVLAWGVLARTSPGSVPYLLAATPLLLFVPGYLVLASVFPAEPRRAGEAQRSTVPSGPTWAGRLVLAFPVSLALATLLGLCLVALDSAFEPHRIARILAPALLAATLLAWGRRVRVPADRRLRLPATAWLVGIRTRWLRTGSRGALLTTGAFVVGAGLLLASVAFAAGGPTGGAGYTSLTLVTENESGDHSASAFPETVSRNETIPVVALVTNGEATEGEYTLVVRVEATGQDSSRIRTASEVTRESLPVEVGETAMQEFAVTPGEFGPQQRVSVYLYRGSAPDEVGPESAYRHAYVSMDVAGSESLG